MKTLFAAVLVLLFWMLTGHACASYWFQVVDISQTSMMPNSEANFTVAVKGLGSSGSYVQLVFKNMSEGLQVSCPKMIKYVFPAGVTTYNCTLKSGDIAPGNYSYVVDVAAKGSPSGKKTGYVEVTSDVTGQMTESPANASGGARGEDLTASQEQARGTPAPGIAAAVLAIALAWRRMRGKSGDRQSS